jgi:hypothetical protein
MRRGEAPSCRRSRATPALRRFPGRLVSLLRPSGAGRPCPASAASVSPRPSATANGREREPILGVACERAALSHFFRLER